MRMYEYQQATAETAVYPEHAATLYLLTGLTAQDGELSNIIAKAARGDERYSDPEVIREMAVKELGDILWFVARFAEDVLDFRLDDVALLNLEKLRSRAERGTIKGDGDNR